MNITNKHDLPQPFVDAVVNDPYDRGHSNISATSLIDSPQRRALLSLHSDHITEDVSDRLWALLGQAVHTILERAEDEARTEERLFAEIGGWTVSGQFDRYLSDGVIEDWKVTTTGKVLRNDHAQWERQLNVLAWLARENGLEVTGIRITAIMRDWSKGRAMNDGNYPASSVAKIDMDLWPHHVAEEYIHAQVAKHQQARDGNLEPCTDEERWYTGNKWAVKKPANKRARRVYDTEAEAIADLKDAEIVEHRPGEYMRCEHYCEAAPFCSQFNAV